MFSSRAFGTAHSSPAPSCRSSRSRSGTAGSEAAAAVGVPWFSHRRAGWSRLRRGRWRPQLAAHPGRWAGAVRGSGRVLWLSITPSRPGDARQMAGMLRHSHGGTDALGRSVCPEGKPAGNITGCPGRVPGAASGSRWCQHPPRTGTPAHPAFRLGSAAYPVSDIPTQTPGSRDVLCPCPSGGERLPVQARLGSGRAEPQLGGIGQSRRGSFPNTSFCPPLTRETPARGEADSRGRGAVKRPRCKTSREDLEVISILEGWQKQRGKLGRIKFWRGAWSGKGVAHSSALVTHVKIPRFPFVNK